MIADVDGRAIPVAPLVLDDVGSLEAMAGAVMRLHSTLLTIGRCYTTDATGERAARKLGRVESVLVVRFARYSANRQPIVSRTSLTRLPSWPVVLSDSPEPKDNQYYAWIQDLVARRRTLDDLANELRCHCIVISDDASHV